MGWAGLTNGRLLSVAEASGMQVLLTGDQNLAYQQRVSGRSIAVLALSQIEWPILKSYLPEIVAAIDKVTPGSFQFVQCSESIAE